MSASLEALQKQIASGEDLSSIVRTMKALAATSVRQYEKAAESLDEYYHTVELGLSVALGSGEASSPPGRSPGKGLRLLALVFGSDHGLAGRFNEQIVQYALEGFWQDRKKGSSGGSGSLPERSLLLAAGEQVATRIDAAGLENTHKFHMPSGIGAITPFVQVLLSHIESWWSKGEVDLVKLFYNRPERGGFSPRAENLLPVDLDRLRAGRLKWRSRSLPTFSMDQGRLLSALLRQYFFVALYRACALSLAAENTSRLAAMQAAEKNISERLSQLRSSYQQERQAAITGELLDIISGFMAVRSG